MISFNLTFKPDSTTGDIPTAEEQAAVTLAADMWGQMFDHDATIDLTVDTIERSYFAPLASARPALVENSDRGFGDSVVARNKILFGEDLNGDEPDGEIAINWFQNWALDIEQLPSQAERQFDLYSTIYHELAHIMGFANFVDYYPEGDRSEEEKTIISLSAFGRFLSNAEGTPVFDAEGLATLDDYADIATGGSSAEGQGLFFNGEKATAANGGEPVGLYSPFWFRGGSSGSHLDDENPSLARSLMLAFADSGLNVRHLSKIERGIFQDLGYSFDSPFEISDTAKTVAVESWFGANAIALSVAANKIDGLSELLIFSTDESGADRRQIGQLSLVDSVQLPDSYQPTFKLNRDAIEPQRFLQFELSTGAGRAIAMIDPLADGTIALGFGGNTQVFVETSTIVPSENLLSENGATIDLSNGNSFSDFQFSIYREATFDSTLGFYRTDDEAGAIVIDELLGTRLMPGDKGYREAVLSRQVGVSVAGENGAPIYARDYFSGSSFVSTFLVVDSPAFDGTSFDDTTVYFGHAAANADGNAHVKMLGDNTFGFEDLEGLGDRDYNDMIVQFSLI